LSCGILKTYFSTLFSPENTLKAFENQLFILKQLLISVKIKIKQMKTATHIRALAACLRPISY
jgi:hypothetical protein